jgi:hypothetical protein
LGKQHIFRWSPCDIKLWDTGLVLVQEKTPLYSMFWSGEKWNFVRKSFKAVSHKCGSAKSKYCFLDIDHPSCRDETNISFTQKNRCKIPKQHKYNKIIVKASFRIIDSPVNGENMRPNVYHKERYYGSTMAIFKVMADCKNKFNSNENVLQNICFTK